MFNTLLPTNINIYATTASNPTESSYACYFDNERQTYLGDVYSVNWIENSDVTSLGSETLVQQFQIVLNETTTSHVQEYGDLTIGSLPLTEFQGAKSSLIKDDYVCTYCKQLDAVDGGNVPLEIAAKKIKLAKNEAERQARQNEFQQISDGRSYLVQHIFNYVESISHLLEDDVNHQILDRVLYGKRQIVHRDCYRQLVDTFHQKCFNLNIHPFSLRKLYLFVNVCERLSDIDALDNTKLAVMALQNYCIDNFVGTGIAKII